MIVQEFYLPVVEWNVKVYYSVTCYYLYDIIESMRKIGCDESTLQKAYNHLFNCDENTGMTYTNPKTKSSVVVVSTASSAKEFYNTLLHEQFHLCCQISEAEGIDIGTEDAAYLVGDIAMRMFPVAKKFLCDCKRDYKKLY